jgi:hypothetical protein
VSALGAAWHYDDIDGRVSFVLKKSEPMRMSIKQFRILSTQLDPQKRQQYADPSREKIVGAGEDVGGGDARGRREVLCPETEAYLLLRAFAAAGFELAVGSTISYHVRGYLQRAPQRVSENTLAKTEDTVLNKHLSKLAQGEVIVVRPDHKVGAHTVRGEVLTINLLRSIISTEFGSAGTARNDALGGDALGGDAFGGDALGGRHVCRSSNRLVGEAVVRGGGDTKMGGVRAGTAGGAGGAGGRAASSSATDVAADPASKALPKFVFPAHYFEPRIWRWCALKSTTPLHML